MSSFSFPRKAQVTDNYLPEGSLVSPTIENVRIVNVNIDDWSVDCVSELANKRFFDIQVMSPYCHYFGGEGIYSMPEVGALAWICKPSQGRFGAPFIMGYQAPFDESNASYRANRQNLNPGDIMIRTRDENFIAVRRGGVIQIGATPTAQRIYVPIQNFIRDFCENYQMFTFGGELTWITDRDDQTTTGNAPTKFSLKGKTTSDEPSFVAEITVGSHGEDNPVKMEMNIYSDGSDSREIRVKVQYTADGDVIWNVEQDYLVNALRDIKMVAEDGNVSFDAAKDFLALAGGKVNIEAKGDWKGISGGKTELIGAVETIVEAPTVKLGNKASSEPVLRGQIMVDLLTDLITQISQFKFVSPLIPAPGPPLPVIAAPAVSSIIGSLSATLSTKVFVE